MAGGFFDGLEERITSPLFLAGAGLLSGEGFGGAMQGLQMGTGLQRQRQKQQAFQQLTGPGGMAGIDPNVLKLAQAAGPDAGFGILAGGMPKAASPTDDMREYEMAKTQGFTGSFMDFDTQRRSASAARTDVKMPAQETAYEKEIGGLLAKEFVNSQTAAAGASQAQADLRVMKAALENPNVYLGTGGEQVQNLKKAVGSLFGVDVAGVPDGEIIQRTAAKVALGMKDQLPGPMSNSDRDFLMSLPANLSASPEGAKRVVELGLAQRQWQTERGQLARNFAARNKGRLTPEFYSEVAAVDEKWGQQMGALARQLQGGTQQPRRAPTAGTPMGDDPFGLRK
jgi:hypothetical protein